MKGQGTNQTDNQQPSINIQQLKHHIKETFPICHCISMKMGTCEMRSIG